MIYLKKIGLSLLLLSAFNGCYNIVIPPKTHGHVEVVFENPDHFTDIKDSALPTEKGQLEIINNLKEFIINEVNPYINDNQKLTIIFTDIDLAGDFETWRGPEWDNVRIVKSIYPPHLCFSWQIVDSAGLVVKKGTEDIRDLAFDMRVTLDKSDSLHIEKDMLKDWIFYHLK